MSGTVVQAIRQSNYLKMPWKNDKGETSQIAMRPKDANFPTDPFLWRLSSARIESSSTFSRFPGYQRAIALTEGKGLYVRSETEKKHLKEGSVYFFPGDWNIIGHLELGPVVDLNLIWNPTKITCQFKQMSTSEVDPESDLNIAITESTHTAILYFLVDATNVKIEGGGTEAFNFSKGDCCVIERDTRKFETISLKPALDCDRHKISSTGLLFLIELSDPR